MEREIQQAGPVQGTFRVPGSKSITNRALICAALARGRSLLTNASDSDDSSLMLNGLNQLGVLARRNGDQVIVEGAGGKLHAPKFPIPVGNAGTTLRFLLSAAALSEGRVVFSMSERMAQRPNDELLEALRELGVTARAIPEMARIEVEGPTLRGGRVRLRADKSSQFLSSLLLAGPYAREDLVIGIEGKLVSASYVKITIGVMRHFGVPVEGSVESGFLVRAGDRYAPATYAVEPDASSASYPLAAAAIAGGEVLVQGMSLSSLQGDAGFARVLERMGCEVNESAEGVRLRRTGSLRGVDVAMEEMPDTVPTLAAVALFAGTPTRVRNVAHLRYKESDRLSAVATELKKIGADIDVCEDGLVIRPSALRGEHLHTHDDHRLAMSFALVGLRVSGVVLDNPECVKKSFPEFWGELETLCGRPRDH
ncbi:MAG: 3-phosphoshikimate 1-carboxyvinyltransferase [Bacteroidota bacterium]